MTFMKNCSTPSHPLSETETTICSRLGLNFLIENCSDSHLLKVDQQEQLGPHQEYPYSLGRLLKMQLYFNT